jgi:hypothetical protein
MWTKKPDVQNTCSNNRIPVAEFPDGLTHIRAHRETNNLPMLAIGEPAPLHDAGRLKNPQAPKSHGYGAAGVVVTCRRVSARQKLPSARNALP